MQAPARRKVRDLRALESRAGGPLDASTAWPSPLKRHAVEESRGGVADDVQCDAHDERGELEVMSDPANVADRRRRVARALLRHLRRGELLEAASSEAVVPLRTAGAARRAKAIDAAAVVQELQAPLSSPLAGGRPAQHHEL